MKSWIVLFALDLQVYYFVSFKFGSIAFVLIFLKILWDIGVFTPIKFSSGQLKNSELYFYDYTGEYNKLSKEFNKLTKILTKFNLDRNVYNLFGIYYDDPKKLVDKSKCRAVIGIIKDIDPFTRNKVEANETLINYFKENNFRKSEIPATNSLRSSFPTVNSMSLIIGIMKFYKALDSSLKDENFLKSFRLASKNINCTVEIYGDKEVLFYVPVQNVEKFALHSKTQ